MALNARGIGAMVQRLAAVLVLLACLRAGSAQGTWSVISLPQQTGDVHLPGALAVDAAGNLYAADDGGVGGRLQKRDTQGNWSVIASHGSAPGQVLAPTALAVDGAGNLYVAESPHHGTGRIQKRDTDGNWSVLATQTTSPGQVLAPKALAVDAAGNLYVADAPGAGTRQIQKRDAQGNWSTLVPGGAYALAVDGAGNLYVKNDLLWTRDTQGNWSWISGPGSFGDDALAVDTAGNLYRVARRYPWGYSVQKRDAQGNWSAVGSFGLETDDFSQPFALAVDPTGNLYLADGGSGGRVQMRDARGNWSTLSTYRRGLGQLYRPTALAVDAAGSLYVAESEAGAANCGESVSGYDINRIQKRDAQGNWSVLDTGFSVTDLAVDAGGNLYVAAYFCVDGQIEKWSTGGQRSVLALVQHRRFINDYPRAAYLAADTAGSLYVSVDGVGILKEDVQGNWSTLDADHAGILAVDSAGNLYVAGNGIQKRDVQGHWSQTASKGDALGQVSDPSGLAVDGAGNLYVADTAWTSTSNGYGQIQKRDAQGHWSVIATYGTGLGQVDRPTALAVDPAGNLYVADTNNKRVQRYTPAP